MTDPQVYLEKMSVFSRMLRLEGLTVSPQETADACRILVSLDLSDRNTVKAALRTVYAKYREEQITFDRVFDCYFVSLQTMRRQAEEARQQESELQQRRQEAEEELRIGEAPMDLTDDQREAYAAMNT